MASEENLSQMVADLRLEISRLDGAVKIEITCLVITIVLFVGFIGVEIYRKRSKYLKMKPKPDCV
jgi:hypothetical protein